MTETPQGEKDLVERLNSLWRDVDALGGTARNDSDVGYVQGVTQAALKLEAAGFSEEHSQAADYIAYLHTKLACADKERAAMRGRLLIEENRSKAAESRSSALEAEIAGLKAIGASIEKDVERVLDEESAWIARPSPEVTRRIALVAGIAAFAATDARVEALVASRPEPPS